LVIFGLQGMGYDYVWYEGTYFIDLLNTILVHIYNNVGGPKRTKLLEVDVFGTSDLWQGLQELTRMNAKPGTADNILGQAHIDQ